jgi:molybdate transport system regulatory protein
MIPLPPATDPIPPDDTRLRLRLLFGDSAMLGPGKAELLDHIRSAGSISEAGRRMGMSYKRAWSLVTEMNAAFAAPLVLSVRGGASGGGAVLTDTGAAVLGHYRRLEVLLAEQGAEDIAAIRALLRDMSGEK